MNKLISVLFVCVMAVVLTVFADEGKFKSIVFDNGICDIAPRNGKIYLATEGGISVADTNGKWIEYHRTVTNGLYSNGVNSILVRSDGVIFAMGYDWLSWKPVDYPVWSDLQLKKTPTQAMGYDLVEGSVENQSGVWAALVDGVYLNGGGQWVKTIDRIAYRLTMKSGVLWGTFGGGIFSYDGKTEKVWEVGKELIAGEALNICAWTDGIIAVGESGCYVFSSDTASSPWVLAYDQSMPKNNGYSVAYFKDRFYIGQGGALWSFDSGWKKVGELSSFITYLEADGEYLYIGTANGLATWDGVKIDASKYGRIAKPHSNYIFHINLDNSGRMLVGGPGGGYRYERNENSPSLNSSTNVYGDVEQSFVDKDGAQWIGYHGRIERNGQIIQAGSNQFNSLNWPYWLVGDSEKRLWLVTSAPEKIVSYAGNGTWADPLNAPVGFAEGSITSVSSTGNRVWIATDSVLYSYDFKGNWTYRKMHYSMTRRVAGDNLEDGVCWVGDGGYNGKDEYNVKPLNSSKIFPTWPYPKRRPTSIYIDYNSCVWVTTDSGAYFLDRKNSPLTWQAVPLRQNSSFVHTLADDYVYTVYVDSATNTVWFGTAGGLTVRHRDNPTQVMPEIKTGMTKNEMFFAGGKINFSLTKSGIINLNLYNLAGRKISVLANKNLPAGNNFIAVPNGLPAGIYICALEQPGAAMKKIKLNIKH